ncbi:MAG: histidine--tRNA ligase [Bacteroidetes bacterium]|nr:MAG: histidine--tRNA ligase [Bacteroidota bacterium]
MKPSIPKGTRDFLPEEVVKRKYMFSVIESVFKKFGYQPIETPAMENLQTLAGKYGEEGDRLLFKVLNNGDFLKKADADALAKMDSSKLVSSIAKRGLRYDLTVPFARFVVMHRNALQLPFKRFQIQPVWRADRPQKGRYQEFYQCDVDVVGSKSLIYEAECVQIYDEVFDKLKLPVIIRINHRKILEGIAEVCGIADAVSAMTISVDKWDKVGRSGVASEMEKRGISAENAESVLTLIEEDDFLALAKALRSSDTGTQGIHDIEEVIKYVSGSGTKNEFRFDATLARGLDYYTGCIFEVESPDYASGSIGGGGRYDDLTGIFGMPDIPGVGVSFGAARIFDALEQLNLFPENLQFSPRILILPMDSESMEFAFGSLSKIRQAGIAADMYPEPVKLQKQFKYANALGVPFVAVIGENERVHEVFALKNMDSGKQDTVNIDQLIEVLQMAK